MREIFKGFLMLRLLAFIPLLIVIVALLGISALTGGSDLLGIAILAAVPVIVVAALGWLMVRRAGEPRRRRGR
jgi:heme A synthase